MEANFIQYAVQGITTLIQSFSIMTNRDYKFADSWLLLRWCSQQNELCADMP